MIDTLRSSSRPIKRKPGARCAETVDASVSLWKALEKLGRNSLEILVAPASRQLSREPALCLSGRLALALGAPASASKNYMDHAAFAGYPPTSFIRNPCARCGNAVAGRNM